MLIETTRLYRLLNANRAYGEGVESQRRFESALGLVEQVAMRTGMEESAPVVIVYNGEPLLSREEVAAAHSFAEKR
jgi:hypothetical protein